MDVVLDLVISLVSIAVVAQYARPPRTHFRSAKMPTGALVISMVVLATTATFLALLWLGSQPVLAKLVGLVIEGLGVWLFYSAIRASRAAQLKMAFDKADPHGMVTTGPYRYLRHPFYTSYLIFWIGWAIATWSPWSLLPLAVMLVIYVHAALGEEAKFARTPMAEEYAAYRRRTGFFWPRFGRPSGEHVG